MDLDITDDTESNGNSFTYFLFLMSMKLMSVESCLTFFPSAELQKEASKPQEHPFYKMLVNNFLGLRVMGMMKVENCKFCFSSCFLLKINALE